MTEQIRLGLIVPSVNIVVEEWYPRVTQQESGGSRVNCGYPRSFLVFSYQAL
jgi:hypothetical protein